MPEIFISVAIAKGSGGPKSPSGVQGRSPGRDLEDEFPHTLKQVEYYMSWFTNCDCRNDTNVKILPQNIMLQIEKQCIRQCTSLAIIFHSWSVT